MYTKEDLRELRDILLKEKSEGKYDKEGDEQATALYLIDQLTFQTDPVLLKETMIEYAYIDTRIGTDPNPKATHFQVAFEALFGDIDTAPLHINDFLATVSKWRLSKGT